MCQASTTRAAKPDPEVVLARLRRRCAEIKREEVETALCKLDASGGLSDRERAAVEAMADRIVAELLAPPTAALEDAADEDPPTAPLARLFDPGERRRPAD
jgi:glutamyl-tRNA reductase